MKFTLLDRSNYLRGLLILIGKDRKITNEEKEMMRKLSDALGFSREFCEDAMSELLENEYIMEEPPKFSNIEVAKIFIKDGIKIAFADKEFHLYELSWLRTIAEANSVKHDWGLKEFENFKSDADPDDDFEITKLIKSGKYSLV